MFKITIFITASALALSAAVWSSTLMQIATGQLVPYVSSQMSALTTKVTQINTKYASDIETKMILKETKTKEIRNLEKEILLELKKMNFDQKYLNAEGAAE